jgi:hypothetical protein
MSDTMYPAMSIAPMDVISPLGRLAQIAQTNVATQGGQIQNQLAGLNLNYQQMLQRQFFPQSGGSDAAGTPQSNVLGSYAASAGANGGAAAPPPPGNPASSSYFGFPAPTMQVYAAARSANPTQAAKTLMDTRNAYLSQLIQQADPGTPGWKAMADQAYSQGYLDVPHYQAWLAADAGHKAQIMQSLVSPTDALTSQMGLIKDGMQMGPDGNIGVSPVAVVAKGAVTAATSNAQNASNLAYAGPTKYATDTAANAAMITSGGQAAAVKAAATNQFDTTEIKVPDGQGGFRVETVQKSQVPAFLNANSGAAPSTAADMANPTVSVSMDTFVNRLMGRESGGNPTAGNPTLPGGATASNAAGGAQFLPGTWTPLARQVAPQATAGMTDAQVAAMRQDGSPQGLALQQAVVRAYAQQNVGALASRGLPVNQMTLGLAHQFGAAGATAILQAAPTAPIASVVGQEVMTANPQLKGKTVSQVLGDAFGTYGINPVTAQGGGGTAGAIPGPPVLSPQGKASLDVTTGQIKADQGVVGTSLANAQAAQAQQASLIQMRDAAAPLATGAFADQRQAIQNVLATYGSDTVNRFIAAATDGKIDPTKAAATQEYVKLALSAASSAEKANNPQGGLGITKVYQSAFPGLETQPDAVREMSNLFLIDKQRTIDHAMGQQQYLNTQQGQFAQPGGQYSSVQNFDAQFMKTNPPQVYVSAAAALNGKPYVQWSKGLTPAQQVVAAQTVWRADPNAVLLDGKGQRLVNPALRSGQ